MRDFDMLRLPLDRNALIEASAGTGKTFTIVNLILRYLLEPFAGHEPLTIGRILVVTFTRAAVDELRGRMRKLSCRAFGRAANATPAESTRHGVRGRSTPARAGTGTNRRPRLTERLA